MLNKAIAWGFLDQNPVNAVKKLKENNIMLRYLSKNEINRLIDNACNKTIRDIIITALCTGMRKSEILRLKWKDIDLINNILYIRDSKNKESREVYINDSLKQVFLNIEKSGSGFIFVNKKGEPYKVIRKLFDKSLEKAGISNCRFHDLRHTFASQLVMSGEEIYTVSRLLGHKSLEMTMRYAHLSPKHKGDALRKLDSIMQQSRHYMGTADILDLHEAKNA